MKGNKILLLLIILTGLLLVTFAFSIFLWIKNTNNDIRGDTTDTSICTLLLPESNEMMKAELLNKGINYINTYDIQCQLINFITQQVCGNKLEVIQSIRLGDYASKKTEKIDGIKISFYSSETYLTMDGHQGCESFRAPSITLTKNAAQANQYALRSETMLFSVKVSDDFDKTFAKISSENHRLAHRVTPEEIKELFDSKKPYCIEYLYNNLKLEDWDTIRPDKLDITKIKLNSSYPPYTLLLLSNNYSELSMFIFKNDNQFVGKIEFGRRAADTKWHIETFKDTYWIRGNACHGYGTGVSKYNNDWYSITDKGIQLDLSFPYYEQEHPYSGGCGYWIEAKNIKVRSSQDLFQIVVDYDLTKDYDLRLDIADKDGLVTVRGNRQVIFTWDTNKRLFTTATPLNEHGVLELFADCREISEQCDAILSKYYSQLERIVSRTKEKTDEYKIRELIFFIDDCSDSDKKTKLLKQIDASGLNPSRDGRL